MISITPFPPRSRNEGTDTASLLAMLGSWAFLLPVLLAMLMTVPWIGHLLSWTDNGELVASASVLGIPHPTGYPLFALLSRVVLILLPWVPPVTALNGFAAVCVSLAAGAVSLSTALILASLPGPSSSLKEWRSLILAASSTSAVLFVSIVPVWRQAVSYEVYALQSLLYASALLAVLVAFADEPLPTGSVSRWWPLAGMLIGFGFANHMMTLFLLPGFLWLGWRRGHLRSLRRFGMVAAGGIVGLSLYAYLPVRASEDPPLNWGDPSSLPSFLAHVSGRQYRVWMFTGWDAFREKGTTFLTTLPETLGWIAIPLVATGFIFLWKRQRQRAWFLFILGTFTILYALNYDIHDIDTYFMLFYIVAAVLGGVGMRLLLSRSMVPVMGGRLAVVALPIVILTANILPRAGSFSDVDETSPEPFARALLSGLPSDATVITGKWDFLYSPVLALQLVEGVRTDVRMIDLNLLRDRTWYAERIIRGLFNDSPSIQARGEAFLTLLRKFERGDPFSREEIGRKWQDFLAEILQVSALRGAVYVDHTILRDLPSVLDFVPEGYLLAAGGKGGRGEHWGLPEYFDIGPKRDDFSQDYRLFCSTAIVNLGMRAKAEGDSALARRASSLAASIDPSNPYLIYLR